MDLANDIKTRTFGLEIEMCNVERQRVALPAGYSWSTEEEIVNTDGSSNKYFGGEVNTPPLSLYRLDDLHALRKVYKQMVAAGGKLKWSIYTHVHIYAGDLELEQLKKVWLFLYVCYPYFKRYATISECDEILSISMPLPEKKYFDGVLAAQSFEALKQLFSNQSKKGYIRHAINISAYFKTKTIEFRMFHATDDFYLAMNCVYSAYRIFYYSISHTLENFQQITSYEDFLMVTKLKYECPRELPPLLYQGNPYSNIEQFQTAPLNYNSYLASALWSAIQEHGHKRVCVVNGFSYYYELFLQEKVNLCIYCQDPYLYLLYLIANGKMTLTYIEKLAWLQDYATNSISRQMALALYCKKLQKYYASESVRNSEEREALQWRAKESIEKTEKSCEKLIRLLTTCEFHIGTLNKAVEKEQVVFFNYGKSKEQKRTFKLIRENSDLELSFDCKRNEYYDFVQTLPADSCFYYFSGSPYLNMHKYAILQNVSNCSHTAGLFLYCNKPLKDTLASIQYNTGHIELADNLPPSDLVIDDASKLKILKVSSLVLHQYQKKYIYHVDECSMCLFPFVVMYDKYMLGGFGFTLPKHKGFDLFQLTDFCTNNSVPRLSKLILYCIQSSDVQRVLSRSMKRLVTNVLSLAYTKKPVSMKYRGVYKKVDNHCTQTYLAYEGQLGLYKTKEDIIEKYQKILKNGNGK